MLGGERSVCREFANGRPRELARMLAPGVASVWRSVLAGGAADGLVIFLLRTAGTARKRLPCCRLTYGRWSGHREGFERHMLL